MYIYIYIYIHIYIYIYIYIAARRRAEPAEHCREERKVTEALDRSIESSRVHPIYIYNIIQYILATRLVAVPSQPSAAQKSIETLHLSIHLIISG